MSQRTIEQLLDMPDLPERQNAHVEYLTRRLQHMWVTSINLEVLGPTPAIRNLMAAAVRTLSAELDSFGRRDVAAELTRLAMRARGGSMENA